MGWPPFVFWSSTPNEINFMYRGWLRANGVDPDDKPLNIDESDALAERIYQQKLSKMQADQAEYSNQITG